MGLNDTISKVPTWGWAAGGVLIVGLAFLLTKGSSSGSPATSVGTPSVDVNDILGQLQDAANQLGSGNNAVNTPTPPPPPTAPNLGTESAREKRLSLEVVSLRKLFGTQDKAWLSATHLGQYTGETHMQRENRLAAEVLYLRTFKTPTSNNAVTS